MQPPACAKAGPGPEAIAHLRASSSDIFSANTGEFRWQQRVRVGGKEGEPGGRRERWNQNKQNKGGEEGTASKTPKRRRDDGTMGEGWL